MFSKEQLKDIATRELYQAGWLIAQEESGIDVLPLPKCNDGSLQAPVKNKYMECQLKENNQSVCASAPLRFRACCRLIAGFQREDEDFLQFYVYLQIIEHFRLANHLLFRTHY